MDVSSPWSRSSPNVILEWEDKPSSSSEISTQPWKPNANSTAGNSMVRLWYASNQLESHLRQRKVRCHRQIRRHLPHPLETRKLLPTQVLRKVHTQTAATQSQSLTRKEHPQKELKCISFSMKANNAPNHILFCQGLDQTITAETLTEVFIRYPGLV